LLGVILATITTLMTVVNASRGWRKIRFGSLILGLLMVSVEGRLPRGYGLKRLIDLPLAWPDQWRTLGLAAPAQE
jgi:hypothetical protein